MSGQFQGHVVTPEVFLPAVEDDSFFSLETTFDELVKAAVDSPEDEVVFEQIQSILSDAASRERIDFVMRSAMQLGAMACLHNHMQGLASMAEGLVFDGQGHGGERDDGHGHGHSSKDEDVCLSGKCGTCKSCKKK